MVFSSLIFLFVFLPVCVILYFLSPTLKIKNIVLLVLSLFFYAWGEPLWVVLLIFSALIDYVNGIIIGRYRGQWQAKAAIIASLVINLSLLGVFKYLGFILGNINALTGWALGPVDITLPIGISFYTFQTLSYSLDVYNDNTPVQKNFLSFLLFVSLFPQLIAGPILRYSELQAQLDDRRTTPEDLFYGITRFMCGLGKKVLLANYAGNVANNLLTEGMGLASLPAADAWLGILMFTFQIYFDFSGYSDMAIGLGRIFGFHYSENFDYPYTSHSITEFWRRWHISLSSWFRDYLYIPLGGNRHHQIRNMFIVWFCTGLWHGASWNFVLWGLYFFVLLFIEKYLLQKVLKRIPAFLSMLYSFVFVIFGWVLFYFTDLADVGAMLLDMFGRNGAFGGQSGMLWVNNLPLILVCFIGATPLLRGIARRFQKDFAAKAIPSGLYGGTALAYNLIVLLLCVISLVGANYNPFLYFRF